MASQSTSGVWVQLGFSVVSLRPSSSFAFVSSTVVRLWSSHWGLSTLVVMAQSTRGGVIEGSGDKFMVEVYRVQWLGNRAVQLVLMVDLSWLTPRSHRWSSRVLRQLLPRRSIGDCSGGGHGSVLVIPHAGCG